MLQKSFFKKIGVLAACLFALLLFATPCFASNFFNQVSQKNSLYAYPVTQKKLTIYSDKNLTVAADTAKYRQWRIISLNQKTAQVSYQKKGKTKTGYVSTKKFLKNPDYKQEGIYVRASSSGLSIYKRASASSGLYAQFGKRSGGVKVSEYKGWTQLIMRKGSSYYLGWAPTYTIQSSCLRYAVGTYKSTKTGKASKTTTVYSQYDAAYGNTVLANGYDGVRTLSSSGCGALSLVNAIYALNGNYISPVKLAAFVSSRGHYYYNQGIADSLYSDISNQWGKKYNFRYIGQTSSFQTLRTHLKKGGVAVALVPGHYIAITKYRSYNNTYKVLDSAVSGTRPTSINGDWLSAGTLTSGSMNCYYFCLFKNRK